MDNMSPQQQQDSLSRGGGQQDNRRRAKSQSYRRQSAPSLVITKALIRSKTLSRESLLVPVCPETCSLVQSYLGGSDRSFLLHGHAQLKTGMQTQDRHLFLFNDTLVIAKAKSANHFKLKAQVCVREMWTADCMDEVCEGSTNPERSFVMGWPTCNCAATFSSAEAKDRWLPLLKSRIREEKEREEPKTIPLRVYGKGINTFAVTKTLPVSNSDSTNEVIRLALQQFSIIGNVKDFQLWVISKRDNAPYPLIGHEFPFSIQMSHVRHAMSQGGGGRDPDGQRAMQVEQMQAYKQCQFIMKPRPIETLHIPAEWSQKPFKRRRSLITWAFWRGSSSNLNEPSLDSAPRGCLFGLPLSSVCVEGALPKPVMDMMTFLYHEGSWTRGIFRRPAGARAVRELRDSLDAGESQLPLTRDHVFLIAGVFKDFLRSIPSSLFCCELHEEWTDVLDEEDDEEEQVQDVKRMICRLPKENALLLRHLLAVLHGIQGNAHENQMTTFNLSLCIAPSMLWPPGALCSPEVEGEGTRKVCELVKFMIEHCRQIAGEDPSSLFGGPPQRLDTDETDSWPYPLTDSSYDSLENELDRSGSPGFCGGRAETPQGSLDSILSLSDQDADPDDPRTQTEQRSSVRRRDVDLSSPSRDETTEDTSSAPERPSPDGRHRRQRRRSAPAVAYKFRPCVLGGSDRLSDDEDDEWSDRAEAGSAEASSPGPSSTRSSPSNTQPPSSCPPSCKPSTCGGGHVDTGTLQIGPPSKEAVNRGTLKCRSGLHPNSWLKKGRRLSLTQPDKLDKEGEEKTGGGSSDKSLSSSGKPVPDKGQAGGSKVLSASKVKDKTSRGGASKDAGRHATGTSGQEPRKVARLLQRSSGPPSHHRSAGSLQFPLAPWPPSSHYPSSFEPLHSAEREVTERKSPSLFYKRSGPSLSLFKQHTSRSVGEGCDAPRRGSEPARQVADRGPAFTRARVPSDPGLRSCLSPNATQAVRDYFSSDPESGREVTLALAESRREWLKRCSDPAAEADFDRLLFAEESYV